MNLRSYALFLREQWELIASTTLLGVIAGMGMVLMTPPKFAATAELFLSTPGFASLGSLATTEASPYRADAFSQERARTYVHLATREDLARRVVDRLQLSMSPEALAAATSASARPDTVLIDITVAADSPSKAKVLANAVAAELSNDIRTLELPGGVLIPNVDPVLTQPAREPKGPSSPNVVVYLAFGATLGFLGGVTGAAAMGGVRGAHETRMIERVTGRPVLGAVDTGRDGEGDSSAFMGTYVRESPRVIALASAVPGSSVPNTAAAAALNLRGDGTRAVLIDIASPTRGNAAATYSAAGLADVLAGQLPLAEAIRRGDDGEVDRLVGTTPINWLPLLRSERFRHLIGELTRSYDLVLLQHPDFFTEAVTTALDDVIDGVILTAPEGRTKRRDLESAAERIKRWNVKLIGTVLLAPTGSDQKRPLGAAVTREIGV